MDREATRASLEHEAKLSAPRTFRMPDLDRVVPTLFATEPRHQLLNAVYFDTADLSLVRAGITLRHRTGEASSPWTLKLPVEQSNRALTRKEITFDGSRSRVPPEAADLVRAYSQSRPLNPIARLHTRRTAIDLRDQQSRLVAEVVDDMVNVYEGRRVTTCFREVEVEMHIAGHHADKVLHSIVDQLIRVGATNEPQRPKLMRALGDRADAPADVALEHSAQLDARLLVRHALAGGVLAMVNHDAGVRLGGDPEQVHDFRVATRRLRSNLRTFSPLLDPTWTAALRGELAWLGTSLGKVRECDVLVEQLHAQRLRIPKRHAPSVDALLGLLATQHADAHVEMLADMRSPRYDRLICMLVEAASRPTFRIAQDDKLGLPADEIGTRLVRRQWQSLERAADSAGPMPSQESLHDIRIHAKRCRYAADALVPVAGKPAKRFAAAIAELTGMLGDHHDAAIAQVWLIGAAEALPSTAACARALISLQESELHRIERDWSNSWSRLTARKRSRQRGKKSATSPLSWLEPS